MLRVEAHHPPAAPQLDALRGPLTARFAQQRAATRFSAYFPSLKRRYRISVEPIPTALAQRELPSLRPETLHALD